MNTVDTQAETESRKRRGEASRFLVTWMPSFLTIIALGLVTFGLNWWIAGTPNGGASLGVVVGLANIVAVVVVAVVSGTLDRVRRVRSLLVLLGCAAGCVTASGVVFHASAGVAAIVLAAVCYVVAQVLYLTYAALMETSNADLAPQHWSAERVATLIQSQPRVERVVVPAAGGTLIAAGALVTLPIVSVALLAVVLATLLFSFRHFAVATHPPSDQDVSQAGWLPKVWRDSRNSMALIRRDPELVFLLVLGVLGNAVVFPFYALLPAFTTQYGLPPREHASLYGQTGLAYGVGLLLGSVVMLRIGRRGSRYRLARAVCAFATLCAVLLMVTMVHQPLVLVVSMVFVGGLLVVNTSAAGAIWLDCTPSEVRVRVFSIRRLIIFSSIPLGTSLMGFGGTALGYSPYLRIHLSVVLALLAIAWAIRTRRTRALKN